MGLTQASQCPEIFPDECGRAGVSVNDFRANAIGFPLVVPWIWDCASLDAPTGWMPYQYPFSAVLHFWMQVCFQYYFLPTDKVWTLPCLSLEIYICMKHCSGYKCVGKLTLLSLEIQINQFSKSFILSYICIFCKTFWSKFPHGHHIEKNPLEKIHLIVLSEEIIVCSNYKFLTFL